MAYAFVQQKANDGVVATGVGSVASGAFGSSLTAGNLLVCFVWFQRPSATTVTLSGAGSPTWNEETSNVDGVNMLHSFYAMNIGGGTTTQLTATFGANVDYPSIYVAEYSGFKTSAARLAFASNYQAAPGTSTDAVTSGLLGTLAAQPAGIVGFTLNINNDTTPSAGTGFTALTPVISYGLTVGGRPQHKRVTATTSVAATWTAGSNQTHHTHAWAFEEASSGSSIAHTRLSLLGVG